MDEKEKDPLDPDNDLEICEEMENNFSKIVSELVKDRSLDRFRKEYELLHEALVNSHEQNKILMEKCQSLNQDIVANANKISSVLTLSQNDQRTIASLRREFERAWFLVQNSQERRSHSEEVIFNLNQEITNLKFLIESANASNQSSIGNEIQISMQDAENAVNSVKSDLEIQQKQSTSLCEQIETKMTETNKMENETISLKREYEQLFEEDKTVSEELEKISKSRIEILDSCYKGSEDIKTETTRIENIKFDIKKQKNKIKKRKRTIIQYNKDKEMLNELTAHVRVRSGHLHEKLSDAQALTAGTQSRINTKKEILQNQEDEMMNLQKNLQEINLENSSITQELNESKQYRKDIIDEKEKSFNYLKDLRQQELILNSKVNSVLLDIRKSDINISASSNEQRSIQQKLKQEEAETKQTESQIHLIESNFTQLKCEEQEKKKRASAMYTDINKFKSNKYFQDSQTANVIDNISELKKKIEDSDVQLKQKDIENKNQLALIKSTQEERDKILKEVQSVERENDEIKSQIKSQHQILHSLKEDARSKDEQCVLLHISYKKTNKLLRDLAIKKVEYENNLNEITEKEKEFSYKVHCSNHILDQAYKDIENSKFEVQNIIQQNRDIVKQFESKKKESDAAVEKNRVLQSLIRISGHKYSQIMTKVEELKDDLSLHIDKQHQLSLLLRGQNAARYEIRRLEKEIIQAQGKIKAMEEELENPRNVHRWHLLESSDPVQYQYVMMRIQLLNDIANSITVSQKVKLIENALREKLVHMRKIFKNSYGANYDDEFNTLTLMLKEKKKQLKSMEDQLQEKRPQVEHEKNNINDIRSMIRDSKIEASERQKKINQKVQEQFLQDVEKPEFVRPPKFAPTKRAPGRYMGGGFEVGRVVNDLNFAPKPPQLSKENSSARSRKRRNVDKDSIFNISELTVKKTKKKTALERMNAVLVPSASASTNASTGSSLSVSSSSSLKKTTKKGKNNKNQQNSNWAPSPKNSSRRHFIARMQNDCL